MMMISDVQRVPKHMDGTWKAQLISQRPSQGMVRLCSTIIITMLLLHPSYQTNSDKFIFTANKLC